MLYYYFGGALAVSLLVNAAVVLFFGKKNKTNRFGGVSIILTFVLVVFFSVQLIKTTQINGLLLGLVLILFFGIFDDLRNLSWKKQLAFQIFLAFLLIFSGFSIPYVSGPFSEAIRLDTVIFELGKNTFSFFGSLLIIFWTLAIINSINWADGIDGLAGSLGILGAVALVLISLSENVNQPAIAIMGIIFSGALVGFLWFNFPPAKIEAGSSGSYAIGFVLASLAIIAGTKIATAMIVLAIPLVDSMWVITERFLRKRPLAKRDKRHLHYKLRLLGWSDIKIVSLYIFFITTILLLSLWAPFRILKLGIIFTEILLVFAFLFYIKNKQLQKKCN